MLVFQSLNWQQKRRKGESDHYFMLKQIITAVEFHQKTKRRLIIHRQNSCTAQQSGGSHVLWAGAQGALCLVALQGWLPWEEAALESLGVAAHGN